MVKSLKKNYIYNLLNTISGLLFPVITFPYASRVMMADGIGQVNFFASIISYISLFTCLGIPMYAIREVAKVREDVEKRNLVAAEVLLLHAGLTVLGYVVVAVLAATVARIQVDIPLFLLLSTTIFFTAIGCEWFYQGVEEFKYITIRGLIVKTVAVILLFCLVKSKEDILWYAGYTVFGVLGGNLFNFWRLGKYVSFRTLPICELKPLRHLKPALRIFVLNLVISLYVNLNSVMLGFMTDTAAVGWFTAATKLSHMILGIVSSLGTVMLPRLSHLIASGEQDAFHRLAQKSLSLVLALTLPLTIGLIMTAPYLIRLFCGITYQPAILTLQIISPIILLIGLSNVLGIQLLYPQGKENIVIVCTAVGAVVNLLLNVWLIPRYAQDGAAVATVFAELGVTASMVWIGRKYCPVHWCSKSFLHYTVAAILMGIVLYFVSNFCQTDMGNLFLMTMIGSLVYLGYLLMVKEKLVSKMVEEAVIGIRKKKGN